MDIVKRFNLHHQGRLFAGFVLGVVVVGGLGAAGAAVSSIPDSHGVIHGCYTTKGTTKALSVINSTSSCPTGDTSLNWNQTGPKGPMGPAGPGYSFTSGSGNPGPSIGAAGTYFIDATGSFDNSDNSSGIAGDCVVSATDSMGNQVAGYQVAMNVPGSSESTLSFPGLLVVPSTFQGPPVAFPVTLGLYCITLAAQPGIAPSDVQWMFSTVG